MKKTLVALAVMAAATSAQAIELYNQDGVSVSVGGDIEVRYKKSLEKDTNAVQEIDDADLNFDLRYEVTEGYSVGGFFQIDDAENAGDAYIALYSDKVGSIKFGRTCTALDDAGIGSDYAFGLTTFFDGDDAFCTDEIVRYDYDNGSLYATVALAQDMNGDIALNNSSTYVDGKLGYRVADFDVSAFYGQGTISDADKSLWSLQLAYNGVENLGLAVAYYDTSSKESGQSDYTTDTVALAASYQLDKWLFAAGYAMVSANSEMYGLDVNGNNISEKDLNSWFINAGYGIAPNTTLYAEVGANDGYTETGDNTNVFTKNETGYAVGIKAFF